MALAEALRVEVVYCPAPGRIDRTELQLAPGSTVGTALQASGVLQRHGIALEAADVGIWCRTAGLDSPLRDRDRVELYRPLTVDPKEARRLRYKRRPPSDKALSGSRKR